MQLSEIKPGEHVTWDTWLGPTTVLIEDVDRFHVSYVHGDGVRGMLEATREERMTKPELNHAREASAQYLADAMDDGMTAETALCLGSLGFDVAVQALAVMRRDRGVSPEGITAAYEERRDQAIENKDVQRQTAAEFTLVVWDGMQRDLAEWMAGVQR